MQHDAARRLQRDEAREQRTVEEIDADRAREHVEPPRAGIGLQHIVAAGIAASLQRIGNAVGKRAGVAQAEIETLCADRRQDVPGLADQSRAARGEAVGGEPGHGEEASRTDLST